jgi:hypothetical protein
LIQKSQISIFRKGLNLFEFENLFDFDLNLGFKFNSAAKIFQKHFHFLWAAQNRFRPNPRCSPPPFLSPYHAGPARLRPFFIDPASLGDVAHLALLAHTSFIFHLRSASCRRRPASRCHACSPLVTSDAWEPSGHNASSSSPPATDATLSLLLPKLKL